MSMKPTTQIICGIDPGLRATGYGVVRVDDDDDSVVVVDAGVIRASPEGPLSQRLAELAQGIDEVFDEHRVEIVAVEQIYSHYQRPRTAILMAHARGVILLEAARRNAQVVHLPSTTVKRHLTGNGRASKEQMQRAVTSLLRLSRVPEPPDVADALAIAVCAVNVLRQPARPALGNDDLLIH
ncbi:MAG: crossover junction endodeoxyribonuclease RuvC [Phycisphaerae bacterium]|jgi:crossover junction endodeoxyribonuclease RuvC|nr:crossover junction endodeoxyribonuclease RuvC [Phycisphaerae bacterium]